jgi:hypothetical protein
VVRASIVLGSRRASSAARAAPAALDGNGGGQVRFAEEILAIQPRCSKAEALRGTGGASRMSVSTIFGESNQSEILLPYILRCTSCLMVAKTAHDEHSSCSLLGVKLATTFNEFSAADFRDSDK